MEWNPLKEYPFYAKITKIDRRTRAFKSEQTPVQLSIYDLLNLFDSGKGEGTSTNRKNKEL